MNENLSDPVIIVGVHRSGTSLLTRMLEKIGLFVGNDLQNDHESKLIIGINNLYFKDKNTSWDQPVYPGEKDIESNKIKSFWHENQQIIADRFGQTDGFWGFKDPRTLTTLPLWLDLFPKAKILYIKRGPWDIAVSLTFRHNMLIKKEIFPEEGDFSKGNIQFTQRCKTIEGSLDFALEQIQFADRLARKGVMKNYHTLSYRDLLADPLYEMSRISEYLGHSFTVRQLREAIAIPRGDNRVDATIATDAYFNKK